MNVKCQMTETFRIGDGEGLRRAPRPERLGPELAPGLGSKAQPSGDEARLPSPAPSRDLGRIRGSVRVRVRVT